MVDRDLQTRKEWAPVHPDKMHEDEEVLGNLLGRQEVHEGVETVEAFPACEDRVRLKSKTNTSVSRSAAGLQAMSLPISTRVPAK